MDERELDFAVRYPFSSAAKNILSESKTALDERIIELALERIRKALKGDSKIRMPLHTPEKIMEIAAFAAARMILGVMRNHYVTERFSVNEAKSLRNSLDHHREDVGILKDFFSIKTVSGEGKKLVHLPTYLLFSPKSVHYRLINREIVNGYVVIDDWEEKRLVEEAARKHIGRVPVVKDPPDSVKKAAKKIIEELPKTEKKVKIRPGDYPPCVVALLDQIKKHQNLPHTARWFLAVYLLSADMGVEQIDSFYSNMPDYNKKTTLYQLKHAKTKGYSVPTCATVGSYGLCVARCGIKNPINWRRKKHEGKGN